jgi:hypothetical protein
MKSQRSFVASKFVEGTKLNSAMQNAIGYPFARPLDTPQGEDEAVSKLTIKEVFAVCRDKYCSINGAPISRLVDDNLRRERSMFKLAQADTKTKVPFADRNGKPDKSDDSDGQVAKLKKDLTYTQKEIAKLKNQPNQAKQNMATERA